MSAAESSYAHPLKAAVCTTQDLHDHVGYNGSNWVACHTAEGPLMANIFNAIDGFLNENKKEVLVVELTHTYNGKGQLADLASMISSTVGHHITPCCRYAMPLHCDCGGAAGRCPTHHLQMLSCTAGVLALQPHPRPLPAGAFVLSLASLLQ